MVTDAFAKKLILDELFDLSLYREFSKIATPESKAMFDELIPIEEKHLAFWQTFFKREDVKTLNFARRMKLFILVTIARLFGEGVMHLILEAIEIYGIRKYLTLWNVYRDEPFGKALKEILSDEFGHEDMVISKITERKINPTEIRDIFFGMNDGLVEILGAVSGFFAAFHSVPAVLIAGFTVGVAGAISMAAGAYLASSSEAEVRETELGRKEFFGEKVPERSRSHPLRSGVITGVSYFLGAMIPVIPVFFGATTILWSAVAAGILIIAVSFVLAFLSGMAVERRILTNLVIMAIAVGVTYVIGTITKQWFGVTI